MSFLMLTDILIQYGFSLKEAEIYLANLSMGSSPASSIARKVNENRVTVYSILKKLVSEGVAHTVTKKNTTFYTVISPEQLLKNLEEKYAKFKEKLPELNAIASLWWSKPKVQFFEGFEGLKYCMKEIARNEEGDDPFMSLLGDSDIAVEFDKFLEDEFIDYRLQFPKKTLTILSKGNSKYSDYTRKHHDFRVINDPLFQMGNEMIIYGNNKVAILLYSTAEMSALTIESQTLHDALKNIFTMLRKQGK
jgi:predicted transcriptional regulator